MTDQLQFDFDKTEEKPADKQEILAALSGDQLRDLNDEFSSFEDLHFNKQEKR